ncbi:cytochrome P450 1A1-like [Ptychodera flava]|uniref:cytochrome P450 1A1-like n=1 Tax=Ptychodera flava TaxID=63121 RepID=UPI00396A0543
MIPKAFVFAITLSVKLCCFCFLASQHTFKTFLQVTVFATGYLNNNHSPCNMELVPIFNCVLDSLKQNVGTETFTLGLLVMTVLLLWHYFTADSNRKRRLCPPGPWGLPVLGNLLSLGSHPHLSLTKMAKKYGPIFKIHLGQKPVVVLTGHKIFKQALIRQANDFAGRPDFESFRAIADGKSMAFNTYSLQWKMQRKIQHVALRTFLSGDHLTILEQQISLEAEQLVKCLSGSRHDSDSHIVNPNKYIRYAVANIICLILFGKRYGSTDETLKRIVTLTERFTKFAGAGNPADIMPWTKLIPSVKQRQKEYVELVSDIEAWIEARRIEHERTYHHGLVRDLTDHLVKVLEEMDKDEMARLQIDRPRIMKTLSEVFGAGFQTVSQNFRWFIMYMMEYPAVQSRVQRELDRVIGPDRAPRLADRPNLPYTQACIYEILRITSASPLAVPHSTTCDTSLNGYFIPKDTLVFVNLWGTNHNEAMFENPDEFNPDRFMSANGSAFNRSKSDEVVTFSRGRRRCLGETLSYIELFLFFSTLLHRCTVQKVDEDQVLNFKGNYGLSIEPDEHGISVNLR